MARPKVPMLLKAMFVLGFAGLAATMMVYSSSEPVGMFLFGASMGVIITAFNLMLLWPVIFKE